MNQKRLGWIVAFLLLASLPLLLRDLAQPSVAEERGPRGGTATLLGTAPAETPMERAYPLPTDTCPPPDTPEPFWVEPVDSPTSLRYQVLTVYLGRGREVTVSSMAGTASVADRFDSGANPALVAVPLAPNATNHLTVTGKVEYFPGCFYTLTTTMDRNGDPLVIVHRDAAPGGLYLPLVRKDAPISR